MSDGNIRQVLAGQKPLVVGHGGSMFELGSQDILVRAIFPGPLKTRAASALEDFELLLNESAQEAPLGKPVDIIDAEDWLIEQPWPVNLTSANRSPSTCT